MTPPDESYALPREIPPRPEQITTSALVRITTVPLSARLARRDLPGLLEQLRTGAGLTPEELAERARIHLVDGRDIRSFESGLVRPTRAIARRLLAVLTSAAGGKHS